MCGISAFLSHPGESALPVVNGEAKHVAAELEGSLDLIAHRGPDARGRWLSDDHQVGEYPHKSTESKFVDRPHRSRPCPLVHY